mgnify:CR=1 FL=1
MKIISKDTLDSTNSFAEQLLSNGLITQPCCITAKYQTSGKGRGSNTWNSESGKNLILSIICFPHFLPAEKQFYLNKAVALSVSELITELSVGNNVTIKWPNDVYAGNKKIAGILIQTAIQNNTIKHAIIGIGVNINQEVFPAELPNATSVIEYTATETNIDHALERYLVLFEKYYNFLKDGMLSKIDGRYIESLYRFGKHSAFLYENKKIFARISGVNEYGWLQIVTEDGKTLCGDMNKIKMIL